MNAQRIMAYVAPLPPAEQTTYLHSLIADLMRQMDTPAIHVMRAELVASGCGEPIVLSTIDLIDGQLALRDMGDLS